MHKGGRTDSMRFLQAGFLVGGIAILYWIKQLTSSKKEGFQTCSPGTELKLQNGMCCPFGIVDIGNCWLKPKCPEGAFWDEQRTACYSKDPNRSDPYVIGYPICNTLNPGGQSFVFDMGQLKCCDPAVTSGPKVCDANFTCPRSTWNSKQGVCLGKTPGFTGPIDTGPGVIPYEKMDTTLVWVFGGLTCVVLIATWARSISSRS
jgi:hypothetical protein